MEAAVVRPQAKEVSIAEGCSDAISGIGNAQFMNPDYKSGLAGAFLKDRLSLKKIKGR